MSRSHERRARRLQRRAAAENPAPEVPHIGPETPTTDEVRALIGQVLAHTVIQLKTSMPGVDFTLIASRHPGDGMAELLMRTSLPLEVVHPMLAAFTAQYGGQPAPAPRATGLVDPRGNAIMAGPLSGRREPGQPQ